MLPATDTSGTATVVDAVPASATRSRRVWPVVCGAALIAVAVAVVTRHSATTPEQFNAFAQRLETLSAPAGSFTPYDPTSEAYLGSAAQGSWSPIGSGTWSSTADPSSWSAVRGWETTVSAGEEPATCRDVLGWLATTGTQLGLTTPGQNESLSTCLAVLDTVRSEPGNSNDAWSGRGTQTADGQPRYRTGVETFTGARPGEIVIRVVADATVVNS